MSAVGSFTSRAIETAGFRRQIRNRSPFDQRNLMSDALPRLQAPQVRARPGHQPDVTCWRGPQTGSKRL